jgi:hypothetical protein
VLLGNLEDVAEAGSDEDATITGTGAGASGLAAPAEVAGLDSASEACTTSRGVVELAALRPRPRPLVVPFGGICD